jgi:hypothetical protein
MKYLIHFLIVFGGYSTFAQSITEKDFNKLLWLEGDWKRTNAKPGRTASESWKKGRANELIGLGVSLKEKDTVFVEKLKILVKDNSIYYVADVAENKAPVYFKFIELTNDGFVCENPDHDFPKKISYKREGNKVRATTSGDGKSIDFLFERNN